jgi:hypothetical protein
MWVQNLTLGDRDRPDKRIWLESFEGSLAPRSLRAVHPSIPETSIALRVAIVEAREFALQVPELLGGFVGMFDTALRAGEGIEEHEFARDLLPREGYLPEARRLIGMAVAADVFGGMGSWYDMGPGEADRNEFTRVSGLLVAALPLAKLAATNSGLSTPL